MKYSKWLLSSCFPVGRVQQLCAVIFAATGTFVLASLIPFSVAGRPSAAQFPLNVLFAPAWFLFDSFLWLSFLIPLLCYAYVVVLYNGKVTHEVFCSLATTVLFLPVLGILIHVLNETNHSVASVVLIRTFGKVPAIILVTLVLVFEGLFAIAVIRRISYRRKGKSKNSLVSSYFGPERESDIDRENEYDRPTAIATPDVLELENSSIALAEENQACVEESYVELSESNPKMIRERHKFDQQKKEVIGTESEEDFTITKSRSNPSRQTNRYNIPLELLNSYEPEERSLAEIDTKGVAATLMATLAEFKIDAEVTGVRRGPVITMFELLPAPGVKISRIVNLGDNIALRLAASRVRIVAPIPGKHAVGIEVPNHHRAIVSFREIVRLKQFRPTPKGEAKGIPVVLGKDIAGEAQVVDLTETPHLLIAGATGAGKSVLVNSLICSILFSRTPEQVRLLLIDPKIVELKLYNHVPHLLTQVITDPKRALQALQYCLYEMDRRYALLDNFGVRDVTSYNRKLAAGTNRTTAERLPYLVIIIDEFADLMATTGKDLESTLARLAAMARAVGIHLVLATQRPSVDVITGLIKANIPSRVAFMVASKFDSRIIIDSVGAEKLLGRGDMLFVPSWDANPIRIQGALVSEDEVERVTEKARELGVPDYIDDELMFDDDEAELILDAGTYDPLLDQAVQIVVSAGKASASYLQRKLRVGYNRAARLVEEMEERGIVGPANGSKPREILHVPSRNRN